MLHDQYIKLKEEGDIGKYKQLVKVLFQILEKVCKKTETIEKALTQIQNANTEIKKEVIKERVKIQKKITGNNKEYSVPQLKMMIRELENIIGRSILLEEWGEL